MASNRLPKLPLRHSLSPKDSTLSGLAFLDQSMVGMGCHEWALSFEGVEWSPVIINTSGSSAIMSGIRASTYSIMPTLPSKLPSSPKLSVFLMCTKKKSCLSQYSSSISISWLIDSAGCKTVMPTTFATPRYMGYMAMATELSPHTSLNFGHFGMPAKPRKTKLLAGCSF